MFILISIVLVLIPKCSAACFRVSNGRFSVVGGSATLLRLEIHRHHGRLGVPLLVFIPLRTELWVPAIVNVQCNGTRNVVGSGEHMRVGASDYPSGLCPQRPDAGGNQNR